jgi:hypothetical protein
MAFSKALLISPIHFLRAPLRYAGYYSSFPVARVVGPKSHLI